MSSHRARIIAVSFALIITVSLGALLRWFLAGYVLVDLPFKHLRHAHSHLAIFAVLFPLAWILWARWGAWTPTLPWRVAYWVFTAVATVGFLRAGYGADAIIGSTGVLGIWLVSAWFNRRLVLSRTWFGGAPVSIVLASMCIMPVALLIRRDNTTALAWVETFLGMLILGVIVPTALGGKPSSNERPGPPALLWTLLAALAALQLGILPTWWTGLGTLGLAMLLGWHALRRSHALDATIAWVALALGLVGLGTGLLPLSHHVGVGALHFLLLGPVMLSLAPHALRAWPPTWLRLVVLTATGAMSLALVASGLGLEGPWLWWSAVAGSVVAGWWLVLAVVELVLRLGTR